MHAALVLTLQFRKVAPTESGMAVAAYSYSDWPLPETDPLSMTVHRGRGEINTTGPILHRAPGPVQAVMVGR